MTDSSFEKIEKLENKIVCFNALYKVQKEKLKLEKILNNQSKSINQAKINFLKPIFNHN